MARKKTQTKKTAVKTTTAVTAPAAAKHPKAEVQAALQTTFVLKGTLKRLQLMYLRVGVLLVEARDKKMYESLSHPDMESYARERLGLSRAALYNHLRIHAWVARSHPKWLEPKPEGFIPDFSNVGDLMWIEEQLERTDLTAARRALLDDLQKKGLSGTLRRSEVRKLRQSVNTAGSGLKALISKLRRDRKRAAALASVSPEVLQFLDKAIELLANDDAIKIACLDPLPLAGEKWHQIYLV